jgi:hypothetical protein
MVNIIILLMIFRKVQNTEEVISVLCSNLNELLLVYLSI